MGRNVELGESGIKFTLYGHHIANGKIVMDEIAKDRFYATYSNKVIAKNQVGAYIRSNDVSAVIETTSMIKEISEDDYCRNEHTGEVFRIDTIQEHIVSRVSSTRPILQRILSLSK